MTAPTTNGMHAQSQVVVLDPKGRLTLPIEVRRYVSSNWFGGDNTGELAVCLDPSLPCVNVMSREHFDRSYNAVREAADQSLRGDREILLRLNTVQVLAVRLETSGATLVIPQIHRFHLAMSDAQPRNLHVSLERSVISLWGLETFTKVMFAPPEDAGHSLLPLCSEPTRKALCEHLWQSPCHEYPREAA